MTVLIFFSLALVQKQLAALEQKLDAKLPRTFEVVFEQVLCKFGFPDG
jgi:hypothetical protein